MTRPSDPFPRDTVTRCEIIKARIDDVVTLAGQHCGYVFGSYLLEVLMPRNNDATADIMPWMQAFKPVELWFPSYERYQNFRDIINCRQNVKLNSDTKFWLVILEDRISLFKVIWPMQESFDFQEIAAWCQPFVLDIDILYGTLTPDKLLMYGLKTDLPPKTATFLESFIYGPNFDLHKLERIFDQYIQQGWQISTPSVKGFVSFRIEKDECPTIEIFQKDVEKIRGEYLSTGPVLCFFHQESDLKLRPEWEQLAVYVRQHKPKIRIREVTLRGHFPEEEYSRELEIFTKQLPNIVLINGTMWDRSMAGCPHNNLPTYSVCFDPTSACFDNRWNPLHWYKYLSRKDITMLNSNPLASTVAEPSNPTTVAEPIIQEPVIDPPKLLSLDGLLSELTLQLMVVTMANNFVKLLETVSPNIRDFMVVRTLRKFNELKGVPSVAKDDPLQLSTWIEVSQSGAWIVFMNFIFLFESLYSQSSRPELVAEVMTTVSHACAAYL